MVQIFMMVYGTLYRVSYLFSWLFLISTWSSTWKWWFALVIFSLSVCLSDKVCFRCYIDLQLAACSIYTITSCPNTSWPSHFLVVVWNVERIEKSAADRIPFHGLSSSTYFWSISKVRIRFANTLWVLSMKELACGFPAVAGLARIPYSSTN